MTHQPNQHGAHAVGDTAERRAAQTHRKTVYLTDHGRDRIQAWADAHGVNFSAACETLALLGCDDERADHIIPALRAVTRQTLAATHDRQTRLLIDLAVDAAAARKMAESVMLQQIRRQALETPNDFEALMHVSRDSRRVLDGRIRTLHAALKAAIAAEAGQQVKARLLRPSADAAELGPYISHAEEDDA